MRHILRSWQNAASPGHAYHFFVAARAIDAPSWHTFALLEWLAVPGDEEPLKRVLLDLSPHTSTWRGTHVAPEGSTLSRVSLCHYAHLSQPPALELEGREVRFECLEEAAPRPRRARLAVAFQAASQPPSFEGNLQVLAATVRAAGQQNVNLLCMSENLLDRGLGGTLEERACSLDDARLQPIWDAVRKSGVWCVFSVLHKIEPEVSRPLFFITAVLASPEGIVGTYSKRQLTMSELEEGITPGQEYPIFQTPWGRLGILVCWDAWFPESATALAQRGAEIICVPLAGDGIAPHWEHVWRARALDNQVFWLASVTQNCSGGAPSRIISPAGEVLAQTREPNGIAVAEVDVAHRESAYWLSLGPCQSEVRNVYEHARREVEAQV